MYLNWTDSSHSKMQATTTTTIPPPTTTTIPPEIDIHALLSQMKGIEGDRERLLQEVQTMQSKIAKLTEGKKAEMQKALDTVINQWLVESVNDETVREEFKKGMSKLVDQTAEESGVWRVVCCASNTYRQKLDELETLRVENDSLKRKAIPMDAFQNENDRKKSKDATEEPKENMNIWDEFGMFMKGRSYEPGV